MPRAFGESMIGLPSLNDAERNSNIASYMRSIAGSGRGLGLGPIRYFVGLGVRLVWVDGVLLDPLRLSLFFGVSVEPFLDSKVEPEIVMFCALLFDTLLLGTSYLRLEDPHSTW